MNGYPCQFRQQYSFMTQCQYAYTCPIKHQCPLCPHRPEACIPACPENYCDINANNEYFEQPYSEANPYQSGGFEEYGRSNLYPQENIYTGYCNKSPYCDSVNYMRIDPRDNITSPWDNNRRFENNFAKALPLPERPFG